MKQLSNIETAILLIGGLLMVVGAGGSMFLQSWAAYIFAPGALLFAAMQMRQSYDGNNFTICLWQPSYNYMPAIELQMNWKKRQKNANYCANVLKCANIFSYFNIR